MGTEHGYPHTKQTPRFSTHGLFLFSYLRHKRTYLSHRSHSAQELRGWTPRPLRGSPAQAGRKPVAGDIMGGSQSQDRGRRSDTCLFVSEKYLDVTDKHDMSRWLAGLGMFVYWIWHYDKWACWMLQIGLKSKFGSQALTNTARNFEMEGEHIKLSTNNLSLLQDHFELCCFHFFQAVFPVFCLSKRCILHEKGFCALYSFEVRAVDSSDFIWWLQTWDVVPTNWSSPSVLFLSGKGSSLPRNIIIMAIIELHVFP